MENFQVPILQYQAGRRFPNHPPVTPTYQFQMDLGDLWDAQLRQLMEDLCKEVVHRELNASPGTLCQAAGGLQQETGTPMWKTRKSPSWEGGDGNQEDNHLNPLPPSTRWSCRMSYQYSSHQIAVGYPMNKHFQWQSHTGKDRCVFWAMVPQGTMC